MKILRRPHLAPSLVYYGERTPNGFVWAHNQSDFFVLQDGKEWSSSMIEKGSTIQVSDGVWEEVEPRPGPHPETLRPWNVLKPTSGEECHSSVDINGSASDSHPFPSSLSGESLAVDAQVYPKLSTPLYVDLISDINIPQHSMSDASNAEDAVLVYRTSPIDANYEKNTDTGIKDASSKTNPLLSPACISSSDQNREPHPTSNEDQGRTVADHLEPLTVDAEVYPSLLMLR
jgi:hypothetical protein